MACGKMAAEWTYFDRLAVWNQLGVAPPAPKGASTPKKAAGEKKGK